MVGGGGRWAGAAGPGTSGSTARGMRGSSWGRRPSGPKYTLLDREGSQTHKSPSEVRGAEVLDSCEGPSLVHARPAIRTTVQNHTMLPGMGYKCYLTVGLKEFCHYGKLE